MKIVVQIHTSDPAWTIANGEIEVDSAELGSPHYHEVGPVYEDICKLANQVAKDFIVEIRKELT